MTLKNTFFSLALFLLIFCSKNNSNIDRGTITENWIYKNETMNFSLQLPRDWNFLTLEQGNSLFIPMSGKFENKLLSSEKIKITQDFNLGNEQSIYPLFLISKNDLENIKTGDRKGDISFTVISSKTKNAENDILLIKKEVEEQLKQLPGLEKNYTIAFNENIKLQFGEKEQIPFFDMTVPDAKGNVSGHRIYAFKNYGDFDLLIIVSYFNDEELANVKTILGSIME